MALDKKKKGKQLFQFGMMTALIGIVVGILSALGYLLNGKGSIIPYTGVAFAMLASIRGYNDMKHYKHRQKRLQIKWKNW